MTPPLVLPTVIDKDGRVRVSLAVFKLAQTEMMKRGKPTDPCGRCGCERKGHQPAPTFSFAKSGGSSGKSVELAVLAPLCCECKFCMCFCAGFVEPFPGQKYLKCCFDRRSDAVHSKPEVRSHVTPRADARNGIYPQAGLRNAAEGRKAKGK